MTSLINKGLVLHCLPYSQLHIHYHNVKLSLLIGFGNIFISYLLPGGIPFHREGNKIVSFYLQVSVYCFVVDLGLINGRED